jgi:hypothetical protein
VILEKKKKEKLHGIKLEGMSGGGSLSMILLYNLGVDCLYMLILYIHHQAICRLTKVRYDAMLNPEKED